MLFFRILIISICLIPSLHSQNFQQQVDHKIVAKVLLDEKIISINQEFLYHNNSDVVLDTIYLHLWANAFSSLETAYASGALKVYDTSMHFAKEENLGGFSNIVFYSEGIFSLDKSAPDKGYILLEKPLKPNEKRSFRFSYTLKVPHRFSRLGRYKENWDVVHWYIKPAVFNKEGWHWFSYHAIGEFFSEYGSFDVTVNRPEHIPIAATGEAETLDKNKTRYTAENVFDFAFFLHPKDEIRKTMIASISGDSVLLYTLGCDCDLWNNQALDLLKESFQFYERKIGPYPYPTLGVVDSRKLNSGMEYPMVVTVGARDERTLDYYINHEIGHQWFYGILGFNEHAEPFLDEGLTTFYEKKYTKAKYGNDFYISKIKSISEEDLGMPLLMIPYQWQLRRNYDESPSKPPHSQSVTNYLLNSYARAAYVWQYLEDYIGDQAFAKSIKVLYNDYMYTHPTAAEVLRVFEEQTNKNLEWFQQLLTENPEIDFSIKKKNGKYIISNHSEIPLPPIVRYKNKQVAYEVLAKDGELELTDLDDEAPSVGVNMLGLDKNGDNNFIKIKGTNFTPLLTIDRPGYKENAYLPLFTYNGQDGIGLGLAFYNSLFPTKKVQYMIAPQFGFSSGELIGNAWLAYNQISKSSSLRKIQYKLSAKRYSDFFSSINNYRTQYLRIVPQVSFHFRVPANSHTYKKLTLRSIYLNEESPVFTGPGDFVLQREGRFIHQLRFDYFDFGVINRKEGWITAEYQRYFNPFDVTESYLKLSGAWQSKFTYRKSKNISIRLFAGGFLANTQRNSTSHFSSLSRGSIALLSQGWTDYSREDYIVNRGLSSGIGTNQIIMNGGGFKDALGSQFRIGLSNDFAASLNIEVDLPFTSPLLPIKPYADLGYYRTSSTRNQPLQGRSLYSGGLMLSYLDGGLEIYFPIVASQEISNIYDQLDEGILQKVSFRLDLHRLNIWDLLDDLNF